MLLGIQGLLLSCIIPVRPSHPHLCLNKKLMGIVDCGMTHMPDANVRKMLKARVPDLSEEIDGMTFGQITE
jgi:hypothetical protein